MTESPDSGMRDVQTVTTTRYWTIEERRWVRIACGVIGPLGIVTAVVFIANGIESQERWMWFCVASCLIVGPLFIAVAFRRRLLIPFEKTVERVARE